MFKGSDDLTDLYAEAGETMPQAEVAAFWRRLFWEAEERLKRLSAAVDFPLSATENVLPGIPADERGLPRILGQVGTDKEKAVARVEVPTRPIEDVSMRAIDRELGGPEERALRVEAFLRQIAYRLLHDGQSWTMRLLLKVGYSRDESVGLIRKARRHFRDDNEVTDTEEMRAIQIARYEDVHRLAKEALDLKTAVGALKQIDRVTGLVTEEGTNPLTELADIARAITNDPRRQIKAVEIDEVRDDDLDQISVRTLPTIPGEES